MLSRYRNLRREEYAIPASTDEVVALVQQILSETGSVHRLVLEAGRGVIAYREGSPGDLEEEAMSLDAALRNSEILEYSNSGSASSFEVIHDMHQLVATYGIVPLCWATGPRSTGLLEKWLRYDRGLPGVCDSILGLPVYQLQLLSEDTLLLCAAAYADAGSKDIIAAIKTNIEVREVENASENERGAERGPVAGGPPPDRRGDRVEEPPEADREVGADSAGQRGSTWLPAGSHFLRLGMGYGRTVREAGEGRNRGRG
jgi:hypothetical protein